jgi:hypothetical protein
VDLKTRILAAATEEYPGSVVIFAPTPDEQFLSFRIEGSVTVGSVEKPVYLAFASADYPEEKFRYVFRVVCGKNPLA